MDNHYHKLVIPENIDLQTLTREVDRGGRFIVYPYNISLVAIMLNNLSPAIFVPAGEDERTYRRKYILLCAFFGWWSVQGILKTITNIHYNKKGGLDITEDVMLNLKEEDIAEGKVCIQHTNMLFDPPSKDDLNIFRKALKGHSGAQPFNDQYYIQECVVARYLNTGDDDDNTFVVGLKLKGSFEHNIDAVEKDLYKKFFKHVTFEFLNLEENSDIAQKLRKQGVQIF